MRLPSTFGYLVLAALGATAACGSTVIVVSGGGGQTGTDVETGAGASVTSGNTGTGTCTTILTWYSQCMCGGTAVGGIDLCQIGQGCGTDGEPDGGCTCQQVDVSSCQ